MARHLHRRILTWGPKPYLPQFENDFSTMRFKAIPVGIYGGKMVYYCHERWFSRWLTRLATIIDKRMGW